MTIDLIFTAHIPAPALGYLIKYREVGTTTWQVVSPNPSSSPYSITGLPSGKKWEGTIQAICSPTSLSGAQTWYVDDTAMLMIYVTNTSTLDGRGARIFFSPNDYYTPNTPASLIPDNLYSNLDLGAAPSIDIPIKYWRGDVSGTLDAGDGTLRPHDGSRIINPATDGLVFDVVSGAWKKTSGIFPQLVGPAIAAFKIDAPLVSTYTVGTKTYTIAVPLGNKFIRVDGAFDAGATGVTFFDL